MLALSLLLIGRLLAHERLRFILMAAQEFRCLLGVTILDLPPLSLGFICLFRCRLLALLHFVQMLTLKSLRFRIVLLLKLLQLRGAVALGRLLLLDAIALELLQLDIMLALERLLLLAMLARY